MIGVRIVHEKATIQGKHKAYFVSESLEESEIVQQIGDLLSKSYINHMSVDMIEHSSGSVSESIIEIPLPIHRLLMKSIQNMDVQSYDGFVVVQADTLSFNEQQKHIEDELD